MHPLLKATAALALGVLLAGHALAQQQAPTTPDASTTPDYTTTVDRANAAGAAVGAKQLSEAELLRIQQLMQDVQQRTGAEMNNPKTREMASQVSRRADDIASKQINADRAAILKLLGINPDSPAAVYIFVSWSMPLNMLRSYAVEAMWTGGTLVFKGVPPNRTLKDFFLKDLRELIYDKGGSAIISIDPRLFDTYQVTHAPTIVLTTDRSNFMCQGAGEVPVKVPGHPDTSYSLCPPMDPNKYWKMAGAVTLDYALEAFAADGARDAVTPILAALRKGYSVGQVPQKAQTEFSGDWKSAPTPEDVLKAEGKTVPTH